MNRDRIVNDGQQRIQQTEEYQQKAKEIRLIIWEKYRTEIAGSNIFKRLLLSLKMQLEIRHEIRELAPNRALYLRRPPQSSEQLAESKEK